MRLALVCLLRSDTQGQSGDGIDEIAFVTPTARVGAPDVVASAGLDPRFAVIVSNSGEGFVGDFEAIAWPGGPELAAEGAGLRSGAGVGGNTQPLCSLYEGILHNNLPIRLWS